MEQSNLNDLRNSLEELVASARGQEPEGVAREGGEEDE